jgi:hypothetical protein
MMATAMGPLLDKAWRLDMLNNILDVAKNWITSFCDEGDRLAGVEWLPDVAASKSALELGIDGAGGGTLRVSFKEGKQPNSIMSKLLSITGEMLSEVKADIDARVMGDGMPDDWLPEGIKGLKLPPGKMAMAVLPSKLQKYIVNLIKKMPVKDLIGELKSYKNPPEAVLKVPRLRPILPTSLLPPAAPLTIPGRRCCSGR